MRSFSEILRLATLAQDDRRSPFHFNREGRRPPPPCHPERSGELHVSRAVERVLRASALVTNSFCRVRNSFCVQGKIPRLTLGMTRTGYVFRDPSVRTGLKQGSRKSQRSEIFGKEERQAQRARRQAKRAASLGALARRDEGCRLSHYPTPLFRHFVTHPRGRQG